MQTAETVLEVLRERGRRGLPCNELYRQMFNPQLYLLAYGKIYANQGTMKPGASAETADGMSEDKIHKITGAMRAEPLKTLAARHKSSVARMAARHKAKIETPHGLRTCFEARIKRDGKPDLVARFGGIPLVRKRNAVLHDTVSRPVPHPRKELIHRLLKRRYELCEEAGAVLVHQVRKLASPGTRPGTARLGSEDGTDAAKDPDSLPHLPRRYPRAPCPQHGVSH